MIQNIITIESENERENVLLLSKIVSIYIDKINLGRNTYTCCILVSSHQQLQDQYNHSSIPIHRNQQLSGFPLPLPVGSGVK